MVNGVINVRKEKGITSFGVVSRLRKIFNQKKIGHTGTLDPDAEGVLPVCLGRATHLVEDLSRGTKSYRAVLLLGRETDTQDAGGTVVKDLPVTIPEEEVRAVVSSFIGKQQQLPPMYSAIKIGGKKLVDLARKGVEIERPTREVEFFDIRILDLDLPEVTIDVTCSHGTYIRTLCHDIGRKLSCGGCMKSLLRTRVEDFSLDDALTLEEIAAQKEREDEANEVGQPYSFMIPIDHFYRDLPYLILPEDLTGSAVNGNGLMAKRIPGSENLREGDRVRLYTADGDFLGVYRRQGPLLRLLKYFYDPGQNRLER